MKYLTDLLQTVDVFSTLFLEAVSSSTSTVACNKKYQKPMYYWMSSALLTSLRKTDDLYKEVKRQPFIRALAFRYKCRYNLLKSLLKHAKKGYYYNEFTKSKNNPKTQLKPFQCIFKYACSEFVYTENKLQ